MRELQWDGCVNVRDLGGLPTEDGGSTCFGAVVRADNVGRLTASGWRQLLAYGVRTIVDLRLDGERAGDGPQPTSLVVHHVSLFGAYDPARAEHARRLVHTAPDRATAIERLYVDVLERCGDHVAAAVRAVGEAAPGGVAIHCYAGKDRTGIVAGLLLRLVGVPREAVVTDYALSADRVGTLVDGWVAQGSTEGEREYRRRVSSAPAEGMRRALEALDEHHGGALGYLRDAGVSERTLDRARARLLLGVEPDGTG
jgi:protein tyrosine/serine phosphatase